MSRFILLLAALAGVLGTAYFFCYHQPQKQLDVQLQQLDYALTLENAHHAAYATSLLKGLQAAVLKNGNPPADAQLFHRAEALNTCVTTLQSTIQLTRTQLRRATANPSAPALLVYPGATATAVPPQALRHLLAACADTLRQLGAAAPALPALPAFTELSVVNALASLTQFESEVLAAQTSTLRQLGHKVGARQLLARPVAFSTAESNVVSPGDTYRAQLLLVPVLTGLRSPMTCNGRPVPVDSNGIGQVRFRAPTRPGPATWMGTIRFNFYGRDTTFRVTVPYRVARR